MSVSYREARPQDVVKFTKVFCPPKFYGLAVEEDGELIGLGVIVWGRERRAWLSMEWSPALLKHPFFVHRVTKMLMRAAGQAGETLYTIESKEPKGAAKWLARLGFTDTGEAWQGERVLRWQG